DEIGICGRRRDRFMAVPIATGGRDILGPLTKGTPGERDSLEGSRGWGVERARGSIEGRSGSWAAPPPRDIESSAGFCTDPVVGVSRTDRFIVSVGNSGTGFGMGFPYRFLFLCRLIPKATARRSLFNRAARAAACASSTVLYFFQS